MYGVALLTSTLLTIAGARIYERCELARDLLKLGVRKEHIATWVCIAYHESRLDTAARNPSSGDHGILQISQIYWCGAGKACGLPCSALRDDDIADDVECAQTIYEEHTRLQGNGFLAWVVYPNYCKHNPKKYLANCDLSIRDGNSLEERGRSSQVYDPYPALNSTLSNSVQRVSYPQSDQSLPGYLAIAALVRGKFESDFERDYNNKHKVLQSQSRVSNVDNRFYEFLASSATRRPSKPSTTMTTTTTTTTMQPEPYYKPVKPWRVIETNQFRRRMMNLDKAKSENTKELTKLTTTFVSTTPTSSINTFTSNNIANNLSPSPLIINGSFQKTVTILNKTCCISGGVSAYLPNQQKYNTHVSFNSQLPVINTSPIKSISSTTNPTPFWNAYNKAWTTPAPNLTQNRSTKKSTEASLINSSIKPLVHQYSPTTFSPIWTTTNRPVTTTVKQDTQKFDFSHSIGIASAPKEKEVFINTSPVVKVTTLKPAILTQGSAKEWTVRQAEYQLYNAQNKASGNQVKTETDLSHSFGTASAPKEKGVFTNTSPVIKVTTLKPAIPTQGSAKEWTVRQPEYQVYNAQNKVSGNQVKTETDLSHSIGTAGAPKERGVFINTSPVIKVTTLKPAIPTQGSAKEWTVRQPEYQVYNAQNKVSGNQVKTETDLSHSIGTASALKEKGVFINTSQVIKVTTLKPAILTQGSAKEWTVRQPEYQGYNAQNRASGNQFKTETQQTVWRRGKSWSNAFQEVPLLGVERSTPRNSLSSTLQFSSQGNLSESVKQSKAVSSVSTQPTPVSNSVSTVFFNDSRIKQITTEKSPVTTTSSPKTTLSIFDLYLNPTKRPQLPNYKFLFSNNSAKNLKIFSGGTTSSPINKS